MALSTARRANRTMTKTLSAFSPAWGRTKTMNPPQNEPRMTGTGGVRPDQQFVNTPLRQRLKEALLRRILGGHYDPGERLVELRIAEEFGTSQGPVREALRELEATGLVTNIPRRGTYVAEVMGE